MRYLEPTTLAEALDVLAEHGEEAKPIAGGQSLLVLMRERLVEPEWLVGLRGIAELAALDVDGSARIGATVTHAGVLRHPGIARGWPAVAAAEAAVSTVQVRNRGTLGGSTAHAFPNADPPAALVASDAVVHLASRGSEERAVPAAEFFTGIMETAARPGELLTAITLPPQPAGSRSTYLKYVVRPLDWAIVGVAVRVALAGDGTVSDARVALNGAADHTLPATDAEQALVGRRPTPDVLAEAARAAARQSRPLDDVDGSVDYKRRMVAVWTRRALERVLG
ncbi:MAG: FAD binding domain-containing protein [Acidimicrobiales bacterium]